MRPPRVSFYKFPHIFFEKTVDKPPQKMRRFAPLINKVIRSGTAGIDFLIEGDLLKPLYSGGHAAYQERVLTQLRKYYPNAATSLSSTTWDIMEKFGSLDLSEVDIIMRDLYSDLGPEPRLPSYMLRSILLSAEVKITSYTKWADNLKENHLHAILSGFTVGDTPGVGTFYDFQLRLWNSDNKNFSVSVHPPKEKPKKPAVDGEKAPPVEKVTVKELHLRLPEKRYPQLQMRPHLQSAGLQHRLGFSAEMLLLRL